MKELDTTNLRMTKMWAAARRPFPEDIRYVSIYRADAERYISKNSDGFKLMPVLLHIMRSDYASGEQL